jgi:hypothetical protein
VFVSLHNIANGVVCIVTEVRPGRASNRGWLPGRWKGFLSFPVPTDELCGSFSHLLNGYRLPFHRVRGPRWESENLPQSTAEFKGFTAYTPKLP